MSHLGNFVPEDEVYRAAVGDVVPFESRCKGGCVNLSEKISQEENSFPIIISSIPHCHFRIRNQSLFPPLPPMPPDVWSGAEICMEPPCQARRSLAGEEGETQLKGVFPLFQSILLTGAAARPLSTLRAGRSQENIPGKKGAHELKGLPSRFT